MAIYLDHASTTPIDPHIAELVAEATRQSWANPASQHAAGRRAKAALEDAKDRVKWSCLGADASHYPTWNAWQLLLTSGGTEANNLALHGLAAANAPVLVGATEHPSLVTPALSAPLLSARTRLIPIDAHTFTPNIDALDDWLSQRRGSDPPALVSVMVGNNETGILADIAAVSQVCRRHSAVFHTDAVQACGKIDLSKILPLVDAISLSAHKLNGPVGVGALLFRSSLPLRPLFFGGGQQLELRPGTESVVAALAMAAAVEHAEKLRLAGGSATLAATRDRFERLLVARVPSCLVNGQHLPRLPHISSVAFPGLDRQQLLMKFDLAGLACSSGSACASGSSQPSHVLMAMGLPPDRVAGTIRFSFGHATTTEEVDQALDIIEKGV